MRVRVEHRTAYHYDNPPMSLVQILRMTPRNYEGQQVRQWRIELDHDAYLAAGEDAFGNITHTLSLHRGFDDLAITVKGEVDTHDTGGVVRGTFERFPPGLYLRETPLTQVDGAIRDFAESAMGQKDTLEGLHALMMAINADLRFDVTQGDVTATAAQTLAEGRGVCQDFAHLFIAAARSRGVPARYVSGYMVRTDTAQQNAGHAWAEAHVAGLGWVGFDPANAVCPTEAHVRLGIGLDYLGAAPVRGARGGGTAEQLSVSLTIDKVAEKMTGQVRRQHQS